MKDLHRTDIVFSFPVPSGEVIFLQAVFAGIQADPQDTCFPVL